MTADLRLTWTLDGHGWAGCAVEDPSGRAQLTASHLSDAPADLLDAMARLLGGATGSRARFEAAALRPGGPGRGRVGYCSRKTFVLLAWARGRRTRRSTLTWEGRLTVQAMVSATSSAVSGPGTPS